MNITKENAKEYIEEKFGDINFIEESHQYFINKKEYTPVSNVIEEYVVHVDWDKKAEEYAQKRGLIKENVQRDWKLNNLKSTISGTRVHEFAESYTNVLLGHPENICDGTKRQYIKEYNTLVPTCPKEDSVVKFFNELNQGVYKYTPVGSELRLSTKYIKKSRPICGTCDLLFWREDTIFEENGFVLGDYKTNKSLYNDYNQKFKVHMLPPFENMIDEALSHYTLQFNLYQRMLESIGIEIIDRELIWLKDDGYEVFKIVKLDDNILDKILFKK